MSGNGSFKAGDCLVEPDLDRISRGSETVTVRPQVMDVLVYLASRGGQIVHADELLENLWPGKVVTSASVYNCITELRHAFLSCDNGQSYVDTVPKRGYRLVAPVTGLDESKAAASQNAASPFSRRMAFIVISLLVAAVFLFAYQKWWVSDPPARSIAVLPFVNMSPDPEQEYFSDGIAEQILNVLAEVRGLKVTARTSSFQFKGQNLDVPLIGQKLNVATVLEGSVRKSGDVLRITAQLVNTADGFHLWSATYDRPLGDIFVIQDEIAAAVVDALKITLLGKEPKVTETNTEAYALYLQARYFINQNSQEGHKQAEKLLTESLDIDPDFAPAWTELGNVYSDGANKFSVPPVDEAYELARDALQKALDIDPNNGRAYAELGDLEIHYTWDFAAADQYMQQALALNPGDTNILAEVAHLECILGRIDECIDQSRHIITLDPLSPAAHTKLGDVYYHADRLDEAEDSIRLGLSLMPGRPIGALRLARVLMLQGDAPAALVAIEQEPNDFFRLTGTAIVQYALGNAEASAAALEELIEGWGAGGAYQIAQVYAFRGEIDNAFDWLDIAYDNIDTGLPFTLLDPMFANLRDDPRWPTFLNKMGLPH